MFLCVMFSLLVPFTFEHGCRERQNYWKFLIPVFLVLSPGGDVKNNQEFKNISGPNIIPRAVWCYWQCREGKGWVTGVTK